MRWVTLVDSEAVAPSAIVAVTADDADLAPETDLVVWRTAAGEPVVMDARCPHQWSHLAAEGVVDGDEIVCTAHFWRFDAAGVGCKLNVKGRRDPKGDIAVFPCREVSGSIEFGVVPRAEPGA